MTVRDRTVVVTSGVTLVAALAAIGALDAPHRHVGVFLSWYAVAFGAYLLAVRVVMRASPSGRAALGILFAVAVAARVVALPARPDLSTDVYRYLWEGRVVNHGANPFSVAPSDTTLASLRNEDYERVSHKSLATIYPPLAQGVFAVGARIHPNVTTLKIIFTMFDVGTILLLALLLRARGRPPAYAVVYAWNPLVMVETAHSGHLDAMGVFFLVLGLLLWQRGRRVWAAVAFGGSALVKYLALSLAPVFARRREFVMLAVMAAVVALGYSAFFDAGEKLLGSLRVYSGRWWFNGPPFMALSGWLGDPVLARRALAAFGVVFALVAALREADPVRYLYLLVGCALLLAPTVYPWYVIWIVPLLCVFPSRAWMAFTGLVMISYFVWAEYDRTGAWLLPNRFLAVEYAPFYALLAWDAATRGRRHA